MRLTEMVMRFINKFKKPDPKKSDTDEAAKKEAPSISGDFITFGFTLKEINSPYEFNLKWELPDDMGEEEAGSYIALFIDQALSDSDNVKNAVYKTLKYKAESENDITAREAAESMVLIEKNNKLNNDNNNEKPANNDIVIKPSEVFKNVMSGGITK